MHFLSFNKNRLYTVFSSAIIALLIGYFCYHAISGDKGFLAILTLKNRVAASYEELSYVRAEKIFLQHHVDMMGKNIDKDLFDEQARRILGHAQKGEKVYFIDDK